MIVFPESINEVNENDAPKALRVIEAYIKYMCQRTEWAMGNMTKTVSAAGVSSAETYILLTALQNRVRLAEHGEQPRCQHICFAAKCCDTGQRLFRFGRARNDP